MNPNDLGKITVESCRNIRMSEYLSNFKVKFKEAILKSSIEILGQNISIVVSKTGFGGSRYWFMCPCGMRVAVLFVHPITHNVGCRTCLQLKYRKQRYKGMIENI